MLILRNIAYAVALFLAAPLLLYRLFIQRRYQTGWAQRLGFVPRRYSDQPCIWLHAVSMGEVNAAATLIAELERTLPQFEIIISTTTDTGLAQAHKLYGLTHRVFIFPWDFSCAVRRAFRRLHPQLCIMMEGEVWPNFTAVAQRLAIPVAVANGRVGSDKGWPRYRLAAPLVRGMFSRLSLALVQDATHAERFAYLGTPRPRIRVVGTLKYDTAEVADQVAGADALARQLAWDERAALWVAGQTGPGEEQIILQAFDRLRQQPAGRNLRLAIVPRKPERFDEVARLIAADGRRLLRYRHVKEGRYTVSQADADAVILGDTMGDLRKFYSLATVVFVGRSLVPMGGSDMMEVAALGRVPIIGPYADNFAQTVAALRAGPALLEVRDADQLAAAVQRLLAEPDYRAQLGRKARQVIVAHRGATARSVAALAELLGYRPPFSDQGIATPAPAAATR